ncbi:MAG: hypothetical protein OEQ53_09410 [Saprospiraceae bacterium]|nr:hypothetical protein [Saprospiraceae bacterium]
MGPHKIILLALWSLTFSLQAVAGDSISIFDFCSEFDSLAIHIKTDIRQLLRKKDEYIPAHITISSQQGVVLETDAEIRTRGNARKAVCYVPPVKLRFGKEYLRSLGHLEYPTIKVVNTCSLTDLHEGYVWSEYTVYQLNQLFTPRSFRTKLISLSYEDTEEKKKPMSFDGFLIEHEDQLADRIRGTVYDLRYFQETILHRESYLEFCMFQYMIGNTDWKILNRHNVRIIRVSEEKAVYPIAYDFDYAGLVNTHYAVPHESLPLENVRDRLYVGPCFTEEELWIVRDLFLQRKDQIFHVLDKSRLEEKAKKSATKYIEEFFAELKDDRQALSIFVKCRNN